MPEVVLRHPDLPSQPIVVNVAVGDYVPGSYRDSGWTIDADTSADDARAESAANAARAAEKAEKAAQDFVAEFPPVDAGDAVVPPAATGLNGDAPTPGQTDNPEQGESSLDLTKE